MKSQIDNIFTAQKAFFATGATLDIKWRKQQLAKLNEALVYLLAATLDPTLWLKNVEQNLISRTWEFTLLGTAYFDYTQHKFWVCTYQNCKWVVQNADFRAIMGLKFAYVKIKM